MTMPPIDALVRICIPVFNDWEAVSLLLARLDDVASRWPTPLAVLLVDDGSSSPLPEALSGHPRALRSVDVLRLRRNLGHQRAIAVGVTYIFEHLPCEAVVIMDGDGEDAPTDVPTLVDRCRLDQHKSIVFAARTKRSESLGFRLGYRMYKALHVVLTGRKVEVGNFSVVPWDALCRLVAISEIWNHYAAAVHKARLPVIHVPLPRARRLAGEPTMNLVALVTHGLSAISVFSDEVGTRLLVATSTAVVTVIVALLVVVGIRAWTSLAIAGWATSAVGLLAVLLVNLFLVMTAAVVFVLQSRDRNSFVPLRDYHYFVLDTTSLHG